MEIGIRILPNGEIHISRSVSSEENQKILEILRQVVDDPASLELFLKSGDDCEQIIGDEPLCGWKLKLLITADIHVHSHRNDPKRIEDGLECLEWIYKTAIKEQVESVIIAGDLFHNRFQLNSYTYAKVCQLIQQSPIKTLLLLGNHDMLYEDRWDTHSLIPFKTSPSCVVIDTPQTLNIGGIDIDFLPYTPLPSSHIPFFANSPAKMLITHVAVADAVLNAKFDIKSVEDDSKDKEIISASAFERWNKVYMGHYHYAQQVSKIVEYIGSPMQLSFGEAGQKKHVIILDTETLQARYIENKISPMFHIIEDVKHISKIDVKNAYVQIRTDGDVVNKFDLREQLETAGIRELEFAPPKQNLEDQASKALFNVAKVINDRSQLVDHYVDSIDLPAGLDKTQLKKVGKDIVAGT